MAPSAREQSELTPERGRRHARANPTAFIPRNHRVGSHPGAIQKKDYQPFEDLVRVLARPYEEQPELAHLGEPPLVDERVRATFCGT